jgi:hypothetical protein
MFAAEFKSGPEESMSYRFRFNQLRAINRSTLGRYCVPISPKMSLFPLSSRAFLRSVQLEIRIHGTAYLSQCHHPAKIALNES